MMPLMVNLPEWMLLPMAVLVVGLIVMVRKALR